MVGDNVNGWRQHDMARSEKQYLTALTEAQQNLLSFPLGT
jgi:hypothetical protein